MKKLKYLLIGALLLLVACKPKKLSYRDPFYFGRTDTGKMYLNSPSGNFIRLRIATNEIHNEYGWAGTVPGQENLNYNTIVNTSRSNYLFRQNNITIITVSHPDSNKVVTVTFRKSAVKFINDSTFIYKQQ